MAVYRLSWIALISLIVLVFAGATVRVTGSGLGCPDWPTCWGCLIPPTSVEQIDVDKLDLEKFKKHAARKGIDPDSITRETVLESFDPVHTWIEFTNRLASLPLGFSALLLVLFSFGATSSRAWIIGLSLFCLTDVVVNAIMGAIVVRSGLRPGIITLHMSLAFLLIVVLVTILWLSRPSRSDNPSQAKGNFPQRNKLIITSLLFFACLFGEGLLGSQLREHTDEMQITAEIDREDWGDQLGATLIYKIHRSFSWTLLITSGLILFWMPKQTQWRPVEPKLIFSMVIGMMLMGIVLGHIAIFAVVQVLHVGLTSILLAVTWHWILRLLATRRTEDGLPA